MLRLFYRELVLVKTINKFIMTNISKNKIREAVMSSYKKEALKNSLNKTNSSNCCKSNDEYLAKVSDVLGYSSNEYKSVPEGSNMGLGSGNPHIIASITPGETVLDLGSGGGFDCFLASESVGETGNVIGVDMTPEMISKARNNINKGNYANTEFRLGEIEHLPVADATIDVIISNCVINLSPEKEKVFAEAFRVLKPGGRLAISDVVSNVEMPNELKKDLLLYCNCITGAIAISKLQNLLGNAGFSEIAIELKDKSKELIKLWEAGSKIEDYVASATIRAVKKI
jgi:ubiquinone/menaquinone biosynthesis C-methylase UbiE